MNRTSAVGEQPAVHLSIAELIAVRTDQMTAGERRAAQTLIGNYPLIGLKTVADFSQQAGVSSPTILRFVSRLGFQNYADFQNTLQAELAAQLQSPSTRAKRPHPPSLEAGHPAVETTIDNIRETFRHLSSRQLQDCVKALANPRGRLYLVGGRLTDSIARYMAAHLSIVRPNVQHLSGQESSWTDHLVDLGKRDALLIFDIRRYQDSLTRVAAKANERGAQIVLVTDQWLSPAAHFARHVIPTRTAVPSAWDSSAALFVVAEVLIGEITRLLPDESARRMAEIDRMRSSNNA